MSYKLDPTCEPGAELARTVRDRLADAISATSSSSRRQSTKERIHAARIVSKKLRAALKLMRTHDEKRYRRESRALGDAARELSIIRDAYAMIDTFDAVVKHYAISPQKFAAVRAALLKHRRAVLPSRAAIERHLRTFVARLREVQHRLDEWEPDIDFSAIAGDFSRTYQRARRAFQAVKTEPSDEAFHEWRKATKAYSYQVRLLRAAWPAAMKELGAELTELASQLGDEHDFSVLSGWLRRLIGKGKLKMEDETAAAILSLILSRRDELRSDARPLGERLFADKRRAVEARMIRWWAAARLHAQQLAVAHVT